MTLNVSGGIVNNGDDDDIFGVRFESAIDSLRTKGWKREDFVKVLKNLLLDKPIRIVMDGGLIQRIEGQTDDHPNIIVDEEGRPVFVNYWGPNGRFTGGEPK